MITSSRHTPTRRRMPAYGRRLQAAIAAGHEPFHGISIWAGDRTPPRRGICAPLAVFPGTDPRTVDWSLCGGRDVFVPHADEMERGRLHALISEIVQAAPRRLILLRRDPPYAEFVVLGGVSAC